MWEFLKQQETAISIDNEEYILKISMQKIMSEIGEIYGFLSERYKEGILIEKETAYNITDCIKTADTIFNKLIEGQVLPIELCYVVDDCMEEIEY